MLIPLFILPLIGLIWILGAPEKMKGEILQKSSLWFLVVILIYNIYLFLLYEFNLTSFQFLTNLVNMVLGIDGLSIIILLLTNLLIPICVILGQDVKIKREYLILIFSLQIILNLTFLVLDIFYFYIFFEITIIPIIILILVWGSRIAKIQAIYYFFFFTIFGSLFLFVTILTISSIYGTTDFFTLSWIQIEPRYQNFFWMGFFLGLAVKLPIIPFHIWLPLAHVEAPVSGSVLLAGILLKLGGYGIARFLLPLIPLACIYFTPFIHVLSILAIIYASLTTCRQIDIKKLIAYSSVAHMGLVTLGLFSHNLYGYQGSIILIVAHGFVSSALFISAGYLYSRHDTRLIKYFSGLTITIPLWSLFTFLLCLANIALPLTINFNAELLVLVGVIKISFLTCIFACLGTVLSAASSLFYYSRIAFGQLSYGLIKSRDLNKRELFILLILTCLTLVFGLFPNSLLLLCNYSGLTWLTHNFLI